MVCASPYRFFFFYQAHAWIDICCLFTDEMGKMKGEREREREGSMRKKKREIREQEKDV